MEPGGWGGGGYFFFIKKIVLKSLFSGGGGGKVVGEREKMLSAPLATAAQKKISVLLSPSVKRYGFSRMRDFVRNK